MESLDKIPVNSRVLIYGSGSAGRSLWMWIRKCRPDVSVLGFIDSFKKGKIAGKRVYQFYEFRIYFTREDFDQVLVASEASHTITNLLERYRIAYSIATVRTYLMENLLPTPMAEQWRALKIKFKALFFKRNIHLFFGEHGGKFIGNNKYYYLYLKNKVKEPVYWVVEDKALYDELSSKGVDVKDFNGKDFPSLLFKASHFYFDNMTWQRKYPWLRYFKADIIHMSHGVGLKLTERMRVPDEFFRALTAKELERFDSKIFSNRLLVSTSEFYARNVSVPAYSTPMENVTLSGYPKNDLFYKDIPGSSVFSDEEVMRQVAEFKNKGHRLIVYAPTFRDMDTQFRYADVIDYPTFDEYLRENRLLLVIKGHTTVSNGPASTGEEPFTFTNILFYDTRRDGYPLLKEADLLVTDYSSIYMDFLHCRKPVLYFIYDYDRYIADHRVIQFDYNEMTPGPKAANYEELIRWLTHFLVDRKDGFEEQRQKILELAFKYHDGDASKRIYARHGRVL
ncbi:MAG: hypothetical protein GY940_22290 [bacterium]|nr:hypothetical protein [bacterium]